MLLRRITQHVQNQNWFAVFIDFLIVVVGVFIGIQVANLNAVQQADSKEAVKLELLKTEFTAVISDLRKAKVRNDKTVDATLEVLRIIRDGNEPADKVAFLETISHSGSFNAGPLEPAALTELLASGSLTSLTSQTLRTALIKYHEQAYGHKETSNIVYDRVSAPHDGFHAVAHVNPNFKTDGKLLDKYDWSRISEMREQQQVMFYGKHSLSLSMEELVKRGDKVLAEITVAQTSNAK
jgi:hypothetical protein